MKATIKIEKEVDIKTVYVEAHVRYWEDATINGVVDEDGTLTPCRKGELWCPIIDIDTGIITNWTIGVTADVHLKVCDAGSYFLKDAEGNIVLSREDNYVPNCLIPGSYGDYIEMQIDENGKIANWEPSLDDFMNED
jgi:hypothetical protein